MPRRGVVYTVAPSYKELNTIWAGTDDGLVQVTTDGGAHWTDVTPPQLVPWAKVSILEASHSDPQTAYAAINTLRLDDLTPYIYRTRDGGHSWRALEWAMNRYRYVQAVAFHPSVPGTAYVRTAQALLTTTDRGDRFSELLGAPALTVSDRGLRWGLLTDRFGKAR